MPRILLVSFQQALRSITLALLPIAFLSLLVWATAGSANGNTADPLRASVWIFLVAHQVPLHLALANSSLTGSLTFLPLAALVIPWFTVKSGFRRMRERLGDGSPRDRRMYIIDFALAYALITYLLALLTFSDSVRIDFYIAIPILFLVTSTVAFINSGLMPRRENSEPWQRGILIALLILIALIALSGLVLSISLAIHFTTVQQLTQVIAPGVFGGFALLLMQLLYLPNIAIAALSYLSGAGIVLTNGSWISPFVHRIDEIPAIPLLGALPVRAHPWLILSIATMILMGYVLDRYARNTYLSVLQRKQFLKTAVAACALMTFIAARAGTGELLSTNLSSVGAHWWLMPIVLIAEILIGVAVSRYLPKIASKFNSRRQ